MSLLSDETVGQMLREFSEARAEVHELRAAFESVSAGQRKCEAQNDALKSQNDELKAGLIDVRHKLDELGADMARAGVERQALAESQALDNVARDRAAVTFRIARIVASITVVVVLPLAGWALSTTWEDYSRRGETIEAVDRHVSSTSDRLARHETDEGHALLRRRVAQMESSVAELAGMLGEIRRAQEELRDEQRAANESLRREIRRGR